MVFALMVNNHISRAAMKEFRIYIYIELCFNNKMLQIIQGIQEEGPLIMGSLFRRVWLVFIFIILITYSVMLLITLCRSNYYIVFLTLTSVVTALLSLQIHPTSTASWWTKVNGYSLTVLDSYQSLVLVFMNNILSMIRLQLCIRRVYQIKTYLWD